MNEFFKHYVYIKDMVIAGLVAVCLYLSLIHFKKWELLLQYQYYWVKIFGSSYRISAMSIRLIVLLIFILVWGIVWIVRKKVLHKTVLCQLIITTCILCGLGIYLLNHYGDTWVFTHVKVEYAFSLYDKDYEGDINIEIEGDSITIPYSLNEDISYFDYELWTEYRFEDLQGRLLVQFWRDDSDVATASCLATFDPELCAYCVRIPEILDDYQCALLTVRTIGTSGGLYSGIVLGSLRPSWYQRFLKTDMLFEDLDDENEFYNAVTEGKIGAGAAAKLIWRIFLFATDDLSVYYFLLALCVYMGVCMVLINATFWDWKDEYERQAELNHGPIRPSRFVRDDGTFNRFILIPINNRMKNSNMLCKAINAVLPVTSVLVFTISVFLIVSSDTKTSYHFNWWLYYGMIVSSVVFHEIGHLIAGLSYGYKISDLGILLFGMFPVGAYVAHEDKKDIRKSKAVQFALAGIEANLLMAGICLLVAMWHYSLFLTMTSVARFNIIMVGVNLLPTDGLDGESALSAICGIENISDVAKKWLTDKKRRRKLLNAGLPGLVGFCVFSITLLSKVFLWALISLSVILSVF